MPLQDARVGCCAPARLPPNGSIVRRRRVVAVKDVRSESSRMRGHRLVMSAAMAAFLFALACAARDGSIVVDEQWSRPDRGITNGSVYDVATIDLAGFKTVRVPTGSQVTREAADGVAHLHMRKALFFVGYPPKPIDLLTARRAMGCAWKADGERLILGTFGEWDSQIEGGAAMSLLLVVPSSVSVEFADDLSGESSLAAEQDPDAWLKHGDAESRHWYSAGAPAFGWIPLPSTPDPSRRASDLHAARSALQPSAAEPAAAGR